MSPNSQYEKFTGNNSRRPKESAAASIPPAANGRDPYRSERMPEMGPATKKPAVSGSM